MEQDVWHKLLKMLRQKRFLQDIAIQSKAPMLSEQASSRCISNGTNTDGGCVTGYDGACIQSVPALNSADPKVCKPYTSCADAFYTTHSDCQIASSKCTTNGTTGCYVMKILNKFLLLLVEQVQLQIYQLYLQIIVPCFFDIRILGMHQQANIYIGGYSDFQRFKPAYQRLSLLQQEFKQLFNLQSLINYFCWICSNQCNCGSIKYMLFNQQLFVFNSTQQKAIFIRKDNQYSRSKTIKVLIKCKYIIQTHSLDFSYLNRELITSYLQQQFFCKF